MLSTKLADVASEWRPPAQYICGKMLEMVSCPASEMMQGIGDSKVKEED
jgi:hypothetical protein